VRGELNGQTHSKFHTTKLALNLDADIVKQQFCDEKFARTGECKMVDEQPPVLLNRNHVYFRFGVLGGRREGREEYLLGDAAKCVEPTKEGIGNGRYRSYLMGDKSVNSHLEVQIMFHVEYANHQGRQSGPHHEPCVKHQFQAGVSSWVQMR
jgi:hypothetical protein